MRQSTTQEETLHTSMEVGETTSQTKVKKTSIVKKKSVSAAEEEQAPFAGMKLKKAKRVQREIKEETLQTVELKHHEFENMPQIEEVKYLSSF